MDFKLRVTEYPNYEAVLKDMEALITPTGKVYLKGVIVETKSRRLTSRGSATFCCLVKPTGELIPTVEADAKYPDETKWFEAQNDKSYIKWDLTENQQKNAWEWMFNSIRMTAIAIEKSNKELRDLLRFLIRNNTSSERGSDLETSAFADQRNPAYPTAFSHNILNVGIGPLRIRI